MTAQRRGEENSTGWLGISERRGSFGKLYHGSHQEKIHFPYLTLGLRWTFPTQLLSWLFHLLIRFFTQIFGFRSNFFRGENTNGMSLG
jgi:hypothetical protein